MSVGLHLSIALPLVRFGLGFSVPFPAALRGVWMTSLSRFVSMLFFTFMHSFFLTTMDMKERDLAAYRFLLFRK